MKHALLSLLLFVAVSNVAFSTEILQNPGFETGTISPWTTDTRYGTGVNWAVTNVNCDSGSYCAIATGNVGLLQTFAGVSVADISSITFSALHPNPGEQLLAYDFLYAGGGDDEFTTFTNGSGWNDFNVTSNLRINGTLVGFEIFGVAGNGIDITMADNFSILANTIPEPTVSELLFPGLAIAFLLRKFKARN